MAYERLNLKTGDELNEKVFKQIDDGIESKQDTLISGANIKTINGESVLGSGNIEIEGGDGDTAYVEEKTLYIKKDTSAEGAEVVANNGETTSATLNTLKVGDTNYSVPQGGAEQEMIVVDESWYVFGPDEEITIVIPEEYRDFERLKNAILDNFGRLSKVAEIHEDEIVFREVRYFPDGASGSIDAFDLIINLNDWSVDAEGGSVPHMIGNDTSGFFSEIVTAKNPLRTLTLTPHENAQVQPYGVAITDVPATATSGTLTQDQLEILQASDSNYIMFNNEKYYLNDKGHTEGYLTYSHVGVVSENIFVKVIITTISTRGWVLVEQQVNAGGSGLDYIDDVPTEINEDTPSLFTVGERLYYKWEREVKVYGVDGIGAFSRTLTRTDENVGLTATSSELQNFFVADTDVVDSNGNHFVKMKKFYMCITQNSDGSQKWQVSNGKVNDNFFLHPFFYDKDGNEIDYAYYGKYKGSVSSSVLKSVSGVSPTYSTTGDNFRTYARANGSNEYHQTDWAAVLLAQCMFMIVYATTKYDSAFTMRGYKATTGTNTQTFFGIEDMVGNGYEFIDGITYSAGTCYYKNYVGEYSGVITSGNSISGIPTGSDYQRNKLYVPNKPVSLIFPQSIIGAVSTSYLCDYFNGSTSSQSATL